MTEEGIEMSQRTASKDVRGAGGGEEKAEATGQGAGNAGGGTPVPIEEVLTTNKPTEPHSTKLCCKFRVRYLATRLPQANDD